MNRVAIATGIFLLSLFYVSDVRAGAWPRAQGDGFGSVSVRLGWPQDVENWTSLEPTQDYSTIYLEYGVTDRLTLGADIGHSVSGSGKTVIFLQWPLRQADSGMQASAQLGVGLISGTRVVRPGLSVGWGLETGWISVDMVAETYLQSERVDAKLDLTWGRNLPKDRKLILQVQTGQPYGRDAFIRLAPSMVVPLGGPIKLETGTTWGLVGDTSMGIKFGLWTDF